MPVAAAGFELWTHIEETSGGPGVSWVPFSGGAVPRVPSSGWAKGIRPENPPPPIPPSLARRRREGPSKPEKTPGRKGERADKEGGKKGVVKPTACQRADHIYIYIHTFFILVWPKSGI